jgi:hypothetical protein
LFGLSRKITFDVVLDVFAIASLVCRFQQVELNISTSKEKLVEKILSRTTTIISNEAIKSVEIPTQTQI